MSHHISTLIPTDDYAVSLRASFFEDTIFFGTVGIGTIIVSIVLTILSTRNPEDSSFDVRIKALVNNHSIHPLSRKEVEDEISNLLVITELNELQIIIDQIVEVDNEVILSDGSIHKTKQKYLKMHVQSLYTHRNLCKDDYFTPDNYFAFAVPTSKPVQGSYGAITGYYIDGRWQLVERELNSAESFTVLDKLVIPPSGKVMQGSSYWIWCGVANSNEDDNTDNIYFSSHRYFTESIIIRIQNNSSELLHLYSRVKDFDGKEIIVKRANNPISEQNAEYDVLPIKNMHSAVGPIVTVYEEVSIKKGSRIHLRFVMP